MSRSIEKKLCTAEEAVALIQDGQTVASEGFITYGYSESTTAALEKRFLETGKPENLTLVYTAGHFKPDGTGGLIHFAHEKLLKRIICGYVGGSWMPQLAKLALDNAIEAYNFPQGVISQLYRDIAAGRPGCITHIGLNTFVDPEQQGGRVNERTPPGLVERVQLNGKTWLWYKAFPVHIGLIRATAADIYGNLVMDGEPLVGEILPIAQAVHNSGGTVIAQVGKLLDGPANPHAVKVPGILVDRIVVSKPDEHYDPRYFSPAVKTEGWRDAIKPLPMDARRIIAGRACDLIPSGAIVNLGIGMPEGVASIAAERGLFDDFTMTVESGPIGGIPSSGFKFGGSLYPEAIIDQPAQFDFYDGGGLDYTALGMGEVDRFGNVNVSKFGPKLAGIGGFANIAQGARRVVFCGTFTAGGLRIDVKDGKLTILEEGRYSKWVHDIEHICFNAAYSLETGQDVWYVTERAVFKLSPAGLELVEVAPGIDVNSQILAHMKFRPIVHSPRLMPAHVFA